MSTFSIQHPAVPARGAAVARPEPLARTLHGGDLLALLVPAAIGIELKVTGRLMASEIILVVLLPFLLGARQRFRFDGPSRTIIVFALIWLWGLVITDLVRMTAIHDYSRGWLRIVFTVLNFVALSLLLGDNRRRFVLFAVGLAVGMLARHWYAPLDNEIRDPWKFGFGFPLTVAVVVAICHRRVQAVPFAASLILFGTAAVHIAEGYRSMAGICFMTGIYLMLQPLAKTAAKRVRLPGRTLVIAGTAVACGLGFIGAYSYAARTGILGPGEALKYQHQTGKFGLLVGGRAELYAEGQAIVDKPILGHGSWARDPTYSRNVLVDLARAGYRPDPNLVYALTTTSIIPTHSFLLGSWVEAGILGAVFWLVVTLLFIRVLLTLYRAADPLAPLIAFFLFNFFWNVLFSPFGVQERLIGAFTFVLLLYARRVHGTRRLPAVFP